MAIQHLTGATEPRRPEVCAGVCGGRPRAGGRSTSGDGSGRRGRIRTLGGGLRRRRAACGLPPIRAGAGVSACPFASAGPASDDAVLVTCAFSPTRPARGRSRACSSRASEPATSGACPAIEAFAFIHADGGGVRRALPQPPYRLPARLPRRLRLPDAAQRGARRADAPRARWTAARDRGRLRRTGRAPRSRDHHRAAARARARLVGLIQRKARGGVPVRLAASAEGDVAPERHHHCSEELASFSSGPIARIETLPAPVSQSPV